MHFLGLPAFLFFYKDIVANVALYNASKPISLSLAFERWFPRTDLGDLLLKSYFLQNLEIPEQWLYIALNTVTQFICISGVSKLTSITTSVSVNLVLALRKFVSLVLSIIIFRNAFTWENWLGTILAVEGQIELGAQHVLFFYHDQALFRGLLCNKPLFEVFNQKVVLACKSTF